MRRPVSRAGPGAGRAAGRLPLLLVVGMVLLQALAVGYASVLAGTAAHAGALALAAGADARAGARESLPGWSRAGAHVDVAGGQVRVRLRPPSPLRAWRGRSRWNRRPRWSARERARAAGGRGLVASALTSVADWLVEPAPAAPAAAARRGPPCPGRWWPSRACAAGRG